jgi:hypothetical protein
MEVYKGIDRENTNIVVGANNKDVLNQQWDVIYVDEMPAELKTGELNKDWGMKVNTPFYVVS